MNTLEWMPILLPPMWLLAFCATGIGAAALGRAWVVGRVLYLRG